MKCVNNVVWFSKLDIADILGVDPKIVDIYMVSGVLKYHKRGDDRERDCIKLERFREFLKIMEDSYPVNKEVLPDAIRSDSDLCDILVALDRGKKKRNHIDKRLDTDDVSGSGSSSSESRTSADLDEALKASELAFIFGIGYQNMARWLRKGYLVSYAIGDNLGTRVVFYEDFARFIFDCPDKWYHEAGMLTSSRNDSQQYRLFKKKCADRPEIKRFWDLYLKEHRRITYEREGI